MTPEQVLEQAQLAVRFARNLCDDVEFSPEDGYRSEPDFLCRVLEAVIARGRDDDQHPRHRGLRGARAVRQLHPMLRERVPNSDKAIWSVHCHNDLGMAVANSLAGVKIGGARQIECTINGLGERAGNCSLEEVVMAVRTRRDHFGLELGIDTAADRAGLAHGQPDHRLRRAAEQGGGRRQRVRACHRHPPGRRAEGARHLRDHARRRRRLERQQDRAGQASGRNAFKQRLQELGIELESEADINAAFARFKDLADRKSEIFDEDIIALVGDESVTPRARALPAAGAAQRSRRPASGRTPRWRSSPATSSTRPRATATARSMPASRRSSRR